MDMDLLVNYQPLHKNNQNKICYIIISRKVTTKKEVRVISTRYI